MNTCKRKILEIAQTHNMVNAELLATVYGIKPITARQYLSALAKDNLLVRIGQGVYAIAQKQTFTYKPSELAKEIFLKMKSELPFTDFCVYDGSILSPIQHHLSINHAIYVETNRDAVESVFNRLKEFYKNVYKRPNATLMYDYIDLRENCIIVKTLVTESPLMEVDGIKVPTLEKLLVDTQKDADFDYLQGSEALNMYQLAFEQYSINTQRLMRYAKRRNISQEIQELINLSK
jgi:predicted transcriptional regulator of viral defense system